MSPGPKRRSPKVPRQNSGGAGGSTGPRGLRAPPSLQGRN
jgi:hypothetical protein